MVWKNTISTKLNGDLRGILVIYIKHVRNCVESVLNKSRVT